MRFGKIGNLAEELGTDQHAAAVSELLALRDDDTIRKVVDVCEDTEDRARFEKGVTALLRQWGPEAVEELTDLARRPNADRTEVALQCLGWIATPEAATALV